jgi:hypothetical protein
VIRAAWLVVVVACLASLAGAPSGCFTPAQRREDSLVRVAREFNDGIRWRRNQDVVAHLTAEEGERFVARARAVGEDIEVADQEVASIRFLEGGKSAVVTVDLTWINTRRALVHKTVVAQQWRLQDGRWICAEQRRVHGERFPLVPEPAAAEGGAPAVPGAAPAAAKGAPPPAATAP